MNSSVGNLFSREIIKAAYAGLRKSRDEKNNKEAFFQQAFHDIDNAEIKGHGKITVDDYSTVPEFEANTGSDICVTFTPLKEKEGKPFSLFIQIKQLFDDYAEYCRYKKEPVPENHVWENCPKGQFFDACYKSRQNGQYQLVAMDQNAKNWKYPVDAGFLVFRSVPKKDPIARFIPLKAFRHTFYGEDEKDPITESDVVNMDDDQLTAAFNKGFNLITFQDGSFQGYLQSHL